MDKLIFQWTETRTDEEIKETPHTYKSIKKSIDNLQIELNKIKKQ